MLILQRYIIRELTAPVLLSIIFFTFVMLLRQLFSMAELLLEAKVGWPIFFELIGILTISLVILTIPMAALLGVLTGIARLSSENEILAMRVSGNSLFRIFYPLFLIGLIGSLGLGYSGFYVVPKIVRQFIDRQAQIQFEMLTKLEPGRNYDDFAPEGVDLYLYFDKTGEKDPKDGPYTLRMENVAMRVVGEAGELTGAAASATNTGEAPLAKPGQTIEYGEQETHFFAQSGILRGDLEKHTLTIELENGTIMPLNRMVYERKDKDTQVALYRENPAHNYNLNFKHLTKTINPRRSEDRSDHIEPRLYTIDQLWDFVKEEPTKPYWRDEKRGRVNGEWKVYLAAKNEIYSRYSLPLALPAFILIAVPLALELRPRAKSVAFLISIALILLYYVMITWAGALGMARSPFTLLAYMAPNVLIGGIGLFLFWRVERQ